MTDGAFYRAMMRWHFYAGIIVLPILALMAVTGALYLYKAEVEAWLYPVEIAARPGVAMLPLSRLIAAVEQVSGESQLKEKLCHSQLIVRVTSLVTT